MAEKHSFRVVIVGASVTGLSLANMLRANGQILAPYEEMDECIIERHGYPMVFLDRAELVNGGVHAVTSDGRIITGDILVGADGMYSTIRSWMWRLAGRLSPGLFDPNEDEAPPCENSCIFGISNPCPGINPGDLHCVFRNSSSYLVTGGPQGRVYWFRFQKLKKKVHGSAIPRYSEKDLQKALSESADDNLLPNLKFSTLVENKVSTVMTPLVEYVYKQWHFDRIITLGDSAHKFHPVGGQGGNAAIESAALLTNNLVNALKRSPSGHLTTVQVESMFADVQSRRKPRLALNHRYSHNRANTEALDTPLKKLMAIHMLPLVDEQVVTLGYCSQHPGGEMLDMLPVEHHENLIPYKQELLCEPMSRGSLQWVLVMTHAIFAVVAASAGNFGPISTDGSVPDNYPKSIMGVESALYQFPLTWTDKASILSLEPLKVYVFSNFLQPIAIIMIEGYCGRNKLTPLGLPSLWLMLIQYAGMGVAIPLYYLIYTLISDVEFYWWPLRRFVPLRHAKHILPARPPILDQSLHIAAAQYVGIFVYFLASYVYTVQAVWDLNRVGRANMNLFTASLCILLAFVSLGPGAGVASVWYIREHAMSRTSFQRKQGVKNPQSHDGGAVKSVASATTTG
ncbi:hydroxylase [Fusarium bulbicola]|nr:hydroxylase [Fusarium bulbicola]